MSRSNGSQPLPAGHAPQAGGYEFNPDARAWTLQQTPAPAAGQAAPQRAAAQQPYAAQGADANYAQGAANYADPYAQHGGYYQAPAQPQTFAAAAPQGASRPAPQLGAAASYAPQFDPYVPVHAPAQPYQAAVPAYQHQAPAAHSASAYPDLRGPTYDQWPGQQQHADPRGYDLTQFAAHDLNAAYSGVQHGQPAAAPAEWGHQQPSGQYAPQGYDPYHQQNPASLQAGLHDQGHAGQYDEAYPDAEAGESIEDEAPRGRRGFLIAATLAGAIVVGGGLTYAYNSLLGGGAGGPPPLVKSASSPSKVKPSEPGGMQFAHADSKVLGRLNDNGTAAGAASDIDASGSKKVATLVVKPDGTIEPPALAQPAASAAPAVEPPVPGLSVISVGDPATQVTTAAPVAKAAEQVTGSAKKAVETVAAAAQKPLVVNPPSAAPKTPVVISSASGQAPAAASALVETAAVDTATAAPAVKKPTAVKKVAAVTSPAAAGGSAGTAVTGTGYMAVIASVPASAKSRLDALTRWADMQQKYGTILQGKSMDVQEANVADKGTYHRLLVGPPGSREQATTVCSQLKAAGHPDCWVMGN